MFKSAECICAVSLAKPFECGWWPPFSAADCHLSMWLIATFQCGWLPPFNVADCHLSIRLIATFQCGWLPPFNAVDCNFLIPPEWPITLAWVPIYSFGLGAVVLIRLMPRPLFDSSLGAVVIYLAWVPFLFKVGKLAIHFWQVRHFTQSLASWPFISGKSAILSKFGKFTNL